MNSVIKNAMTPGKASRASLLPLILLTCMGAQAATFTGTVVDINGNPVVGAMVTLEPSWPGPTYVTAFSDPDGRFSLPDQVNYRRGSEFQVAIRALGYELVDSSMEEAGDGVSLTVIARATDNQVASAPASAWLQNKANHDTTSTFVLDCVGCHQVPSPEFRHYAAAIADIPGTDRDLWHPRKSDFYHKVTFIDDKIVKSFDNQIQKDELIKINSMSSQTLLNYIKSWPWMY